MERDFLQVTYKETYANYNYNLKVKKDIMSVEHNKLHKVYKNME
jgi:hypothetical protein